MAIGLQVEEMNIAKGSLRTAWKRKRDGAECRQQDPETATCDYLTEVPIV